MTDKSLEGVYPVLSLPFTKEREVDYESLKTLINFLNDRGVDGLMLFGLNSEFYKITDDESKKIIETLVSENRGRGKLIIGVGKPGTETTISQAKFCENLNVDALIIFPPYCVPISPIQLFNHYVDVANSVNLPIVIQDSPRYSGVNMDLEFFIKLAERCHNIRYAKIENQLSGPKITNIIEGTKGKLRVFAGKGGTHYYEHLLRNVSGIMPGCAVIELFVAIFNHFRSGHDKEAENIFEDMATLLYLEDQELEYYIACEKIMLEYRGVISTSISRKPHAIIDKTAKDMLIEKLDKIMREYNLQ